MHANLKGTEKDLLNRPLRFRFAGIADDGCHAVTGPRRDQACATSAVAVAAERRGTVAVKSRLAMTRRLLTAGALALAAAGAFGQGLPAAQAEGGDAWFIELVGAPEADGNSRAAVRAEKDAYRKAANDAGVRYRERRSFDVLFNGFAVDATAAERTKLARLPGFKAMYPIETIGVPTPEPLTTGVAPHLAAAITMTGANLAQSNGWTGAGIKVGIIDSGIDIDHPDLGGSGAPGTTVFPSARVAHGYDFVGDAFNGSNLPVPDDNPNDCSGHGTHVAGIVGANGAIKGVAPDVTFGVYRVLGCVNITSSDITLAALERALADGMHVVNLSLGFARRWPQDPVAMAGSRLAKKGVVVVASIGNNGPGGGPVGEPADGLYAASAPAVGERVIGVASYDNAQRSFTVNGTPFGFNPASGAPLPPTSGSLPMARTGTTSTNNDACGALAAGSLTGRAVLIRRGTCSFFVKATNAMNAGAAAVVLYNNTVGALNVNVADSPSITIPVVTITDVQGAALDGQIAAGPTTLTWTDDFASFPYGTGGLISKFSSFGLAPDLSVKPNIGAPGGFMLSTVPLEQGGYDTYSGTSMASPHVAGAVALLLQAKPGTKVDEVATLLQNTAVPKAWSLNPTVQGALDHVHRQGAGMLDIAGAIAARATVEPSEIALGESANGQARRTLRIKNHSSASVTYVLSHQRAMATGPFTFAPNLTYFDTPAMVGFNKTSVTVGGFDEAEVQVTIAAPGAALPDKGIYGGYLVLTPRGGGTPLRVPFAGFKGDYQSIQVLTPTPVGFPRLAKFNGSSYSLQPPAGATYTLVGNDIPYFLIHLEHQSEMLLLEALDAASGDVVGRVSLDEWLPRNSTPNGFFAFVWDGTVFKKDPAKPQQWRSVADGQYHVRVTVRKALANKNNPAHFETWISPPITIDRP